MSATTLPAMPNVTPHDRLSFALFLSIIIHMIIIFGVGFTMPPASPKSTSLDVTLVPSESEEAPKKADYLAQNNQQGSGTEEEKKLLATPKLSSYQSNRPNPEPAIPKREMPVNNTQTKIVSANNPSIEKLPSATQKQTPLSPDAPKSNKTLLQRSLEVASLSANLDYHQQAVSKRPRVGRFTSLSTLSTSDAYYLDSWRRKVELWGNLNYPEAARQNHLYGDLRLAVRLRANGTIENIELLKSSGHKVLDEAAFRIVKMAAPFAPFTPEMKKEMDKLEIIRTWQFSKDDALVSGD